MFRILPFRGDSRASKTGGCSVLRKHAHARCCSTALSIAGRSFLLDGRPVLLRYISTNPPSRHAVLSRLLIADAGDADDMFLVAPSLQLPDMVQASFAAGRAAVDIQRVIRG
jgi:hypothetical protein